MTIIENKNLLNKLSKIYGFKYDKTYLYVTNTNDISWFYYNDVKYKFKYFDGCIKPFLVQVD